jgi:hypothetical protein
MPSAVGCQPTGDRMGQLQERITSTRQGSVTSVQAIYVPADDLTDPAPAVPLPTSTRSSRSRPISEGDLPRDRPAGLDVRALQPTSSPEHYETATRVRVLGGTRTLQTSSRSSAWTSSRRGSPDRQQARKIGLPLAADVRRQAFTGQPGDSCASRRRSAASPDPRRQARRAGRPVLPHGKGRSTRR